MLWKVDKALTKGQADMSAMLVDFQTFKILGQIMYNLSYLVSLSYLDILL